MKRGTCTGLGFFAVVFLTGVGFGGIGAAQSFGYGRVLGTQVKNLELHQVDSEDLSSIESETTEEATSGTFHSQLIGGSVVTAEEYPGVFYTRQGNSRCTGTLIGDRVVASAAHCVANGGSLSLTYKGKTYSGKCTHAPEYRGNSTADWALCLLTEAVPDTIAESINIDATRLAVGKSLVLMGYGCTQSGGSGGNDGKLRTGSAPITRLPQGTNYDIVTKGRSALCFGDSGGPSFVVDTESGRRYQTGINSRGDISTTSYLSSLHNDTVIRFYKNWSEQNSVKICGLHADALGCR